MHWSRGLFMGDSMTTEDSENIYQARLWLHSKHCFLIIREDHYLIYRKVEGPFNTFVSRCKTTKGLLRKAKAL